MQGTDALKHTAFVPRTSCAANFWQSTSAADGPSSMAIRTHVNAAPIKRIPGGGLTNAFKAMFLNTGTCSSELNTCPANNTKMSSHAGISEAKKNNGIDEDVPSNPGSTACRKDVVVVWDLDETLIIFNSLLNGSYAAAVNKTAAAALPSDHKQRCLNPVEIKGLGSKAADCIFDFLDGHFMYEQIEHLDPMHISDMHIGQHLGSSSAPVLRASMSPSGSMANLRGASPPPSLLPSRTSTGGCAVATVSPAAQSSCQQQPAGCSTTVQNQQPSPARETVTPQQPLPQQYQPSRLSQMAAAPSLTSAGRSSLKRTHDDQTGTDASQGCEEGDARAAPRSRGGSNTEMHPCTTETTGPSPGCNEGKPTCNSYHVTGAQEKVPGHVSGARESPGPDSSPLVKKPPFAPNSGSCLHLQPQHAQGLLNGITPPHLARHTTVTGIATEGSDTDSVMRGGSPSPEPSSFSHKQVLAHIVKMYGGGLAAMPLSQQERDSINTVRMAIDEVTGGWLSHSVSMLNTCTAAAELNTCNVHHCIVTTGQLVATLGKLMIFGLADFFPADQVYSASKGTKLSAFKRIRSRYGCSKAHYLALGDGPDEQYAATVLKWPFIKISLSSAPCWPPGRPLPSTAATSKLPASLNHSRSIRSHNLATLDSMNLRAETDASYQQSPEGIQFMACAKQVTSDSQPNGLPISSSTLSNNISSRMAACGCLSAGSSVAGGRDADRANVMQGVGALSMPQLSVLGQTDDVFSAAVASVAATPACRTTGGAPTSAATATVLSPMRGYVDDSIARAVKATHALFTSLSSDNTAGLLGQSIAEKQHALQPRQQQLQHEREGRPVLLSIPSQNTLSNDGSKSLSSGCNGLDRTISLHSHPLMPSPSLMSALTDMHPFAASRSMSKQSSGGCSAQLFTSQDSATLASVGLPSPPAHQQQEQQQHQNTMPPPPPVGTVFGFQSQPADTTPAMQRTSEHQVPLLDPVPEQMDVCMTDGNATDAGRQRDKVAAPGVDGGKADQGARGVPGPFTSSTAAVVAAAAVGPTMKDEPVAIPAGGVAIQQIWAQLLFDHALRGRPEALNL